MGADWSLGDDDCCDEEEDDDLRPVRVSQIDMATERREDLGWMYYKGSRIQMYVAQKVGREGVAEDWNGS